MQTTIRIWKDPNFRAGASDAAERESRTAELQAPLIAELESIEARMAVPAAGTAAG